MTALWTYRASLVGVVDADTVDLTIDLGFNIRKIERVRLLGVDAPERNTPEGAIAHLWTRQWFTDCQDLGSIWPYLVTTHKPSTGARDKYGRYVVEIWCGDRSINKDIVAAGMARPWP